MIVIDAPAKVNLFLEVCGRRPDGYHELESVMQTVGLFDRLTIEPADALTLECDHPALAPDRTNLVLKTAFKLREKLGITAGARMVLEKHIPLGAGLGGGSSDAAAALTGLQRLWGRELPEGELNALAASIGADVPFFLKGGTCVARGIGERLEPLPASPDAWFVLVYPGFGVATPWVYKNLRFPLTNKHEITRMVQLLKQTPAAAEWKQYLFNRLEEVVLPEYDDLRSIKKIFEQAGCSCLMSGSGSTVFGVVASFEEGEILKRAVSRPGWGSWVVRSVSAFFPPVKEE